MNQKNNKRQTCKDTNNILFLENMLEILENSSRHFDTFLCTFPDTSWRIKF